MRTERSIVLTALLLSGVCACERREQGSEPYGTRESPATGADEAARGAAATARDAGRKAGGAARSEMERVAGRERSAKAEFKARKDQKIEGKAKLEETADGVKITVEVENAPPGKKGIHVHEKGDCSNIEGESMGGHFVPEGEKQSAQHGLPSADTHHLGDLGNIDIKGDGDGRLEITAKGANLKPGDAMSFAGRALVIHEGEDKGVQPTGGAGKPIACAVIVEE